ncbi:MAG: hypothetical protein VX223_09505, partial [Myxococcota bacterium]|nr:hypothetical protein [Myxococcota bacterium]
DPSDSVETTISWFIDDQPAGNGETLQLSSASPGASVSCSAIAIDNQGATTEQFVEVTVQNSPPVVGLVTLNPAAPEPGTVIHCEGALWSDDCNILPKYDFAWYVNGSQLLGAETTTISTATLPVGSDVYCVITPFDGLDQGIPVASNVVTIGCVAGSCDDEDSCTDDSCNPLTGLCEQIPIDCNDGDPCTNDQCDGGICSHPPKDCGDGDPCTMDSCGEFGCTSIPKDCADNDPCTTDVCEPSSGVCHQTVVPCDDQDPCTSDYCDPTASVDEQCKHLPIAPGVCGSVCEQPSDCGDGNPCTLDGCGLDGCTNEPPDCDDGESCTVDTCDPLSGECTHEILPNCFVGCTQDSHCDDGKVCTTDVCTLGQCESTADPSCVPCSGLADCANENLCVVVLCELAEGQIEGECTTSSRTCYDGVNCTFDTCDPNVGCVFKTLAGCEVGCDDDADCDDGNLCTDDVCELDESACSNTLIACNDGDPCTLDACTPDTGTCASLPWPACDDEGGDCADDTKCQSVSNACLSGYCAGPDDDKRCIFEPVLCNDANSCTTDVCESEGAGCVFIQESSGCIPGDCETAADCDVGDLCAVAACVDGLCAPTCIDDFDCDDSDANTLDSCLSDGRCIHVPGVPCTFDADCWDENACTRETCDMGTCRSRPIQCDDGRVCTKALAPCAGEPDAITTARALLGCNTEIGQVPACDPTAGCYRLPALNCGQSWIPGEQPLQYECTTDADCSTEQPCQPGSCIDGYCTVEIIQCTPSGPDVMAYCNPSNGACEELPQPGWAGCDEDSDCRFVDGFPDVGLDHCSLGYCDVHALEPGCFFVQRHCDDQNPCTADSCDPAIGCVFTPVSDCNGCSTAAECDDLNDCTVDACDNFQCVYTQVDGCDSCQNFTCNVVGGAFECSCLATAAFQCPIPYCQSDAECSDGLTCTLDECLPTGICTHTSVDCVFDSGCVFSAGECLEGFGCVSLADAECTQDCETALDCETEDSCAPAECISGSCSVQPVVCDDSDPCTTDLCMPTTGSCIFVASPGCASQLCDTSDAEACAYVGSPECTPAACIDGTCTLVNVTCDDHNPCTADTCDVLTGQCEFSHIVDCTGCVSAADCSDGNTCTLDSCTDEACDFTLIDDCLPCVADTDCPISSDACAPISCDSATSKCVTTVMSECEVCDATETLLGQAEQCNDGNDCTVDSCNDTTNMCVHLFDEALPGCAPVFCESSWTCAQESDCRVVFCDFTLSEPACDHNAADATLFPECPVTCSVDLDCFDGDPCTLDRCNSLTQTCSWYTKDCVDSLACTTDHVCTDAGCQFAPNAECSASCVDNSDCVTDDACFTGACIPDGSGGTRCEVQIKACEDGDVGTFDWCAGGVCQSVVLPDGEVANACVHADDCGAFYSSALGLPSGCTTFQCIDGFCASTPVVCDDSNPCTEDSCDPSIGCEFTVQAGCLLGCTVDADCDDDDVLTQDVCSDNACRNYFG